MPLHDVKCSYCGHIEEIFFQPGNRPNTVICENCDYLQKFKPMLSSPIIKMAGERPVEAALEQSASDGLF
jgi:predicted nucleic acid-binding Zn ribbon protein